MCPSFDDFEQTSNSFMVKDYIDPCTRWCYSLPCTTFSPVRHQPHFYLAQCLPLTEETSEVVDPSVDSSTEDKEKTPECSDNISTGNCHTSTTFTESEDGSEEIQSTRPVRKGDSWFQIWYPQNTWSFLRNFHVLCRLVTIKGKENQRSCFRGLGRQCSS